MKEMLLSDEDRKYQSSNLRVGMIMVLTYLILLSYMSLTGVKGAYLSAVVPTIGFYLSTVSLSWVKPLFNRLKASQSLPIIV